MVFKIKHPTLTSDEIDVIFQVYNILGIGTLHVSETMYTITYNNMFSFVCHRIFKEYASTEGSGVTEDPHVIIEEILLCQQKRCYLN